MGADRGQRTPGIDGYAPLPSPALVVYRMDTGEHQQTGVVAEVSVADYRDGRVRRHEATHCERARRHGRFLESSGVERMPVVLTHPTRTRLRSLLIEIADAEPDMRSTSSGGTTHTLWFSQDAEVASAVRAELGHIDALYIADGHHRMAAADAYAPRTPGLNLSDAFTLGALFPSDEMLLHSHHRCFPLKGATPAAELLARLAEHPMVAWIKACDPAEAAQPDPGTIAVETEGRCYRMRLRVPATSDHVRESLEVVALDERIVPDLWDLFGPDGSSGAGDAGPESDVCWCSERNSVRFVPHPVSIEQVMAISDAGLLLPPKSTWFEPKASADLLARKLRQ
ncbi:DUF1015 family protein [Parasphingorhabdus pacifica]